MSSNLNVLWATDGSAAALAAVPMLRSLVVPAAATVHVLAVAPKPMLTGARPDPVYLRPWNARERKAAEEEAFDVAVGSAQMLDAGGVNVSVGARFGQPIQEILRAADRLHADLIVVGAKGYSNLKLMLLGSVAQGVLEYARRPVLLVRPSSSLVKTAIVGIDGSKEALKALKFFERLAVPEDAIIVLSHAIELSRYADQANDTLDLSHSMGLVRYVDQASDALSPPEINERTKARAEADLAAAHDVLAGPVWNVENEILLGLPANQLLYSAEQRQADIIVVGSRTPSRVRKYLVGGIAEKVAREADTSVLVVR